MSKIVIAIVAVTVISVTAILGYAYRQGIKVSTKVCEEDKLRQELVNKEEEIKNKENLNKYNIELLDEANKQLASEQKQVLRLEKSINELLSKPTDADSSYQCVPDSVLKELRELRLLRGVIR